MTSAGPGADRGGPRVFSAGADLEAAKAGLATSPLWERLSGAIAALPCLSIAALNGTLAGGAFGMALACDIRLAVPGARFFYPVAQLGYLPQPSDPGRLVALVGPARAKMILLASQKIAPRRRWPGALSTAWRRPRRCWRRRATLPPPRWRATGGAARDQGDVHGA